MARLQQGYLFDNRYQLLRKLGEGGYAEVWLVKDTISDIEQALKIFLPDSELDDKVVDLFRKEFKLVYNINHSNLLKYGHFSVCMGYPYLVMPYYRLGSAESLVGHCSEQVGWKYLHDVAAGLQCLHAHRPAIIHQDIKPANVLLDGDNFIITDFGISASMYNMVKGSTGNQVVQGTRPYMPPEKFLDNPEICVENDIWSLGASLYELLTGECPYGKKGGENQLNASEYPELPSTISGKMRYVIRKCLSLNPSHRPTAKELVSYAVEQMEKNQTPQFSHSPSDSPYTNSGNHSEPIRPIYNPYSQPNSRLFDGGYPSKPRKNPLSWIIVAAASIIGVAVVVFLTIFLFNLPNKDKKITETPDIDTTEVVSPVSPQSTTNKKNYVQRSDRKTSEKSKIDNGGNSIERDDEDDEFENQHTNEMIASGKNNNGD